MTITQLITELQKLQAEHGDLPVTVEYSTGSDGGWGDEVLIHNANLSIEPYLSGPVGDDLDGPHIHLS
jgi:hypothetical protein